jgi:hypothetical protein
VIVCPIAEVPQQLAALRTQNLLHLDVFPTGRADDDENLTAMGARRTRLGHRRLTARAVILEGGGRRRLLVEQTQAPPSVRIVWIDRQHVLQAGASIIE